MENFVQGGGTAGVCEASYVQPVACLVRPLHVIVDSPPSGKPFAQRSKEAPHGVSGFETSVVCRDGHQGITLNVVRRQSAVPAVPAQHA